MTDITRTILLQLGGNQFAICVGAKHLCEINNGTGLRLDFMKNPSKANQLKVLYDAGTDTFTMQFIKKGINFNPYTLMSSVAERLMNKRCCTLEQLQEHYEDEYNKLYDKALERAKAKAEPTIIYEVTGCYCDDLRRIFENTTKLRTSLHYIYADAV